MPPKDFRFLCCCAYFFVCISNNALKAQGSNLKCCFKVLKDKSVSYELNEPPGPSCNTTWSVNDVVVVDEYGDVDQNTVADYQPQKIILKGSMVEQVTYRQDCLLSGNSYKGTCNDSCGAADDPIEAMPHRTLMISICIFVVITIIIIIIIICCKRHQNSTSIV